MLKYGVLENVKRELIYVDDVADAIIFFTKKFDKKRKFLD